MIADTRAVLQIKIYLNKISKNKNSINKHVAEIIGEYSHGTVLEYGSVFECWPGMNYFLINKLFSPFWIEVTHVPPRVDWIDMFHGVWYSPDFNRASGFHRKKVFRPFSKYPYIKKRKKRYMLKTPIKIKLLKV
jgi:hypothetical protein